MNNLLHDDLKFNNKIEIYHLDRDPDVDEYLELLMQGDLPVRFICDIGRYLLVLKNCYHSDRMPTYTALKAEVDQHIDLVTKGLLCIGLRLSEGQISVTMKDVYKPS